MNVSTRLVVSLGLGSSLLFGTHPESDAIFVTGFQLLSNSDEELGVIICDSFFALGNVFRHHLDALVAGVCRVCNNTGGTPTLRAGNILFTDIVRHFVALAVAIFDQLGVLAVVNGFICHHQVDGFDDIRYILVIK